MKVLLGLEPHGRAGDDLARALEHVIHREDELTVVLLHEPGRPEEVEPVREAVLDRLGERGAELRALPREPAGALVEMAEREGFDELVLGGGERSPSGKIRLGKAAEFAVLNAHTTVVLVR